MQGRRGDALRQRAGRPGRQAPARRGPHLRPACRGRHGGDMGRSLFLFPGFMMSLFTPDEQVIELGQSVLRIVAVSEPVFGASIILEGVFDGIGDTRTPLVISIATMWGVRILATYVCVNWLHLGLTAGCGAAWLPTTSPAARCSLRATSAGGGSSPSAWRRPADRPQEKKKALWMQGLFRINKAVNRNPNQIEKEVQARVGQAAFAGRDDPRRRGPGRGTGASPSPRAALG